MNLVKKIVFILLFSLTTVLFALSLTSCDRKAPPAPGPDPIVPTEEIVQIQKLSAQATSTSERLYMRRSRAVMSFDDETEPMEPVIPDGQYIVMYKSQSEITFTIKLNNPKGESIDAIELTCDDPDAQIMVDGEYKPIQYQDNEGIKSRIVNWAQEDPYEKVYYIKTTSMDDINTLRVIDLKVNGEWQNQALSNDELKIYKMEEEDLKWVFMKNTPEYYQWKFEKSDKISNLVVKLGTELEPDENGVYTTVSGKVVWEYDYTFDGVTVHWKDERVIETVSWVYDSKVFILTYSSYEPSTQVWINNIEGTDVDKISICKEPDMIPFELSYNMNGVLAVSTVLFLPEDGDTCYLQFGGSTYYIDTENLKLVWIM